MVLASCEAQGVGESEYLKIVEKLTEVKKNKLLKLGLPYEGSKWSCSIIKGGIFNQFDAILVKKALNVVNAYEVDTVPESIFENRREASILRDANSLAKAAEYLLSGTSRVFLVDPYFQNKKKCTKVLNAMMDLANKKHNKLREVFVYLSYEKCPYPSAQLLDFYHKELKKWLNEGIIFKFYRVNGEMRNWDFHARYIFTAYAGIRYDRGFVEPAAHDERKQKTDVSCMESNTVDELYQKFYQNINQLDCVDCIKVSNQ